jgi:hypothetical protein
MYIDAALSRPGSVLTHLSARTHPARLTELLIDLEKPECVFNPNLKTFKVKALKIEPRGSRLTVDGEVG